MQETSGDILLDTWATAFIQTYIFKRKADLKNWSLLRPGWQATGCTPAASQSGNQLSPTTSYCVLLLTDLIKTDQGWHHRMLGKGKLLSDVFTKHTIFYCPLNYVHYNIKLNLLLTLSFTLIVELKKTKQNRQTKKRKEKKNSESKKCMWTWLLVHHDMNKAAFLLDDWQAGK